MSRVGRDRVTDDGGGRSDGRARIWGLEPTRSRLEPLEPVGFEFDVEIERPVEDLRIETDLAWATIAPDQPIARDLAQAPDDLLEVGRFRIHGAGVPSR